MPTSPVRSSGAPRSPAPTSAPHVGCIWRASRALISPRPTCAVRSRGRVDSPRDHAQGAVCRGEARSREPRRRGRLPRGLHGCPPVARTPRRRTSARRCSCAPRSIARDYAALISCKRSCSPRRVRRPIPSGRFDGLQPVGGDLARGAARRREPARRQRPGRGPERRQPRGRELLGATAKKAQFEGAFLRDAKLTRGNFAEANFIGRSSRGRISAPCGPLASRPARRRAVAREPERRRHARGEARRREPARRAQPARGELRRRGPLGGRARRRRSSPARSSPARTSRARTSRTRIPPARTCATRTSRTPSSRARTSATPIDRREPPGLRPAPRPQLQGCEGPLDQAHRREPRRSPPAVVRPHGPTSRASCFAGRSSSCATSPARRSPPPISPAPTSRARCSTTPTARARTSATWRTCPMPICAAASSRRSTWPART